MKLSSIWQRRPPNEDYLDNIALTDINHQSVTDVADYIIDDILTVINRDWWRQYWSRDNIRSRALEKNEDYGPKSDWLNPKPPTSDDIKKKKERKDLRDLIKKNSLSDGELASKVLTKAGIPIDKYTETGYYFTSDKPKFSAELIIRPVFNMSSPRIISGRAGVKKDGKLFVVLIIQISRLIPVAVDKFDSLTSKIKKAITKVLYHEIRHITQIATQIQQSGRDHVSAIASQQYVGNPHEIDAEAAAMAYLYLALPPENQKPIRSMKGLIKMIDGGDSDNHLQFRKGDNSWQYSRQQSSLDAQRKILHKVMKLIDRNENR